MKTELTSHEIAMYLGCGCRIKGQTGDLSNRVIGVHSNGNIQVSNAIGAQDKFELEYIVLILRPLSDMTEEERSLLSWAHSQNVPTCYPTAEFQYLLSKSFDLFGYIEAGLAIDQKTIKE